jgi:AcrR family transcriptional regulator
VIQGFHLHTRSATASAAPAQAWFTTRQRVMRIAKQQFASGYDAVFLSDIAREARVPDAELATHFRTKLDLLLAIFDEGWALINPGLAEIAATAGSAHAAMLSMLTATMHILEKDRELAQLLMFEGHRLDPETGRIRVSAGYRRFMGLCTDLAVRGQADGSFKTSLHPRVVASALVHAMEGLMRDRMLAEEEGDRTTFSNNQLISTFNALVSQMRA